MIQPSGHACRFCWGVIVRDDTEFVCPTCLARTQGDVEEICGCGMSLGEALMPGQKMRRGVVRPGREFRCTPNPEISDRFPTTVIVVFGGTHVMVPGGMMPLAELPKRSANENAGRPRRR